MDDNIGIRMQGPLFALFLRGVSDLKVCSPRPDSAPHFRLMTFTKNDTAFAGSFNLKTNTGFVIERSEIHKL